jgi:PEP-CTERM motif-containing protein
MGAINAPLDALLGVFLTNSLPTSSAAPAGLDFSAAGATSFASLSPGLKQVFFIGDGLTGNGTGSVQTFIVPQGATRLFLGGGDAFGWFNNSGSFTVNVSTGTAVVPEPGTLLLVGTGLFGFLARRKLF